MRNTGGSLGPPRLPTRLERVADHGGEGLEQDHDVTPQGPVLDVLVVEPGPLVDRRVAAQPVHLGQTRETDGHAVTVVVAGHVHLELLDEERALGPGPDERHVALQDVPQLREARPARSPCRMWPILVTASLAGFHSTSERALTRMDRNLRTSTMTPRSPTRCWRKWTGPGLVSFTTAAMAA